MNNIFKISAVVVLLVALVYLIVNTFFMSSGSTNTVSSDKLEVSIDKVLINMKSGSYKYMKADMAFKMKDERNKKNLVKSMPHIRDTILHFSSNQDSNRLSTPEGKQQYKEDLKDLIYESYGLEIENIYFRDFVLAK